MQTNCQIRLRASRRAFAFCIPLCCLFLCFAAFGGTEISRTYSYKGFDTNGNLLVQGIITLHLGETNRVTGDWTLRVLNRHLLKELGPQDGSGKIAGFTQDERVFLNLNPKVFGDNIYLDGKVTKADIFKITGKWGRYGYFGGKLIEGRFEMFRKVPVPKSSPLPKTSP